MMEEVVSKERTPPKLVSPAPNREVNAPLEPSSNHVSASIPVALSRGRVEVEVVVAVKY